MQTNINTSYVIFLGVTAALGGLLFGFDIAIISGAGPFLTERFKLSDLSLGWTFSSLLFGCALGSGIAGRLTDCYGRKKILLIVAVLFAITSLATGLAPSFAAFVVARFTGGLAVGGASILSPMYVAEVSPPSLRGRMGTLYQLSIVTGILISYAINYLLRDVGPANWRWMFITGVAPSVLFLAMLLVVPETPRYLFMAGKEQQGFAILERIAGRESAEFEASEIRASFTEQGEKRGWICCSPAFGALSLWASALPFSFMYPVSTPSSITLRRSSDQRAGRSMRHCFRGLSLGSRTWCSHACRSGRSTATGGSRCISSAHSVWQLA
jgi:SP family arabinose:H+ symporter-like MFS transporter